jgi:glycosyltransferase involved in cell wall biosynthesis
MSAGVPLVVENQGGWPEMIHHGRTGFLYDNEKELIEQITLLAHEPQVRQTIVEQARQAVETQWADTKTWWSAWKSLLEDVLDEPCLVAKPQTASVER